MFEFFFFCGLRGKAPNESLGGNKMIRKGNSDWDLMIIDNRISIEMIVELTIK